MDKAVRVVSLRKAFGAKTALSDISFTVGEGEVFGLIGPNGAGKTTCLRILATVLKPSGGDAYIFGRSVVSEAGEVRGMISYLPEEAGVYKNLTGLDFLKLTARLYGGDERGMVKEGIEVSGLGDAIDDRMGTYSKGMRRRILVARALMVNPRVAILDEPTAGLDVDHAVYVRKIVKRYAAQKGTTFLISSHNMLEVAYLCERVAFIDRGRILAEGVPGELLREHGAANLEELFMKVRGEVA